MGEKRGDLSIISTAAALLLFCCFVVGLMFCITAGAAGYKRMGSAMEAQYNERTCLDYIVAKARNGDRNGSPYIGELAGVPALVLEEEVAGEVYLTMIYYYEGYIMELYTAADSGLTAADGLTVIPAEGLELSADNNLISITCRVDGRSASASVWRMSERAGE